ncbi:nucleotide exchange factor GrpE [Polaromonas sp.]|uniref:nucleotide exchange factor GrpE n=1 Tax=Polaromonas sp. TaxID=1869339 RepID=UPI001A1B9280|nr:nucleotide exchange factor GrpE [Burkholderiales bacterium]
MDAEAKERLIDEFRACLEDWEPADGNACDAAGDGPAVDLALLFAELSVLRNEVRAEARQFKTALDDMRALTELLSEQNRRLAQDLERAREAEGAALRQSERRLLLEILEIRDRIGAAMGVFSAYRPGWLSRLAPAETRLAQGLGEGITLTLRRLDDVLAERRVRAIEAVGGRLDPNTMRAIATAVDADRAPGEVLREARRGYMRDDELLRLAEVIVNKRENQI